MKTETVSITDYRMMNPTLARVVISYTGRQDAESLRNSILAKSNNLVAPVENSFREIRADVSVGFVRSNKELRYVDDPKQLRASYRVMSSNIMMDNKDKSLWEVRTGKGGTFLARQGNEDLSELIEASIHRRNDIPGLRHVALAKAEPGEFASFVSSTGDMDYGFVTASNTEKAQIVSYILKMPMTVNQSLITALAKVPVKKSFVKEMVKAGLSRSDKDQAIEYWKRLYFYDPNYLNAVIDQVNEGTTA